MKTPARFSHFRSSTGLTMIELLVTLTIVTILSSAGFVMVRGAQMRARDAQRKQDLQKIKLALEDYFNDNSCYPDSASLSECGGDAMSPYLRAVPCDPLTETAYEYVPLDNQCQGYRVYTELEQTNDEDIAHVGCDGASGCGYTLNASYNYGVAVGVPVYYTE